LSPSLQSRLAWRLALVFAAVILATSLALFFHRRSGDAEMPTGALTRILDDVIAGLSRGADGAPRLALDEDDGSFDFAVLSPEGHVLLASASPPAPIGNAEWHEGYVRRRGPAGDRLVAFTRADTALGPVEIRIETDANADEGELGPLGRELRDEMLPILLPTLLTALAIGALTLSYLLLAQTAKWVFFRMRPWGGVAPASTLRAVLPLTGRP